MTEHVYGEDNYDKAFERDRALRDRAAARWAEDMSRAEDISTNPRETEAVRLAAASLAQEMAQHAAWQDAHDGRATEMQDVPQPTCYVCREPLLDARSLHLGAHRVPAGTFGYDCWTQAQDTIS